MVPNDDFLFYKAAYLSHSSCLHSHVDTRIGSFQQYFDKLHRSYKGI